jgi:O-antigen/teichoic acid export membrane protein
MGLIFFGRIAQAIIALLALRIMTTILSPEEMGKWSLLLAVSSFFVLGLVNPVGMFINRRLHSWVETGKINQYMKYYAIYLISVSVVSVLIFYVFNMFYVAVPGVPFFWVMTLLICAISFATLNQTYTPFLNLLGHRVWFVLLTLGSVVASLLASVSLVYLIDITAEVWQLGQLIGQVLMALIGGAVFFKLAALQKRSDSTRESMAISFTKLAIVFTFCWPLAISVLLTWVQTQSYRFLVQDMIGLESLGLFVVGYGVSMSLIGVYESIISTYFIPMFYKRAASEDKSEQAKAWHAYASAMLGSLIVTVTVIIAVSQEFAHVLLDEKYYQASQYIIWGALAEAARVTVGAYALLAHAGMDTKKLVLPNILAASAAPLFVYVSVKNWLVDGVGLGLVAAGFVAIVSSHLMLSKSFQIIMPWLKLFKAGGVSLVLIVLSDIGYGLFGPSETFLVSFVWLLFSGIFLFVILFVMLNPQIKKEVV